MLLILASLTSGSAAVGIVAVAGAGGACFAAALNWHRLPRAAFWFIAWELVTIALAALVGSLPPASEAIDFLSGEGRILVAYLPLIAYLPWSSTPAEKDAVVRRVATAATWLMAAFVAAALLPPTRHLVVGTDGLLKAWSSSHHIPGLIGGTLVVVALTCPLFEHRWRLGVGVVGLAAVVLASSRTSLVGLAIAMAYLGLRSLTPVRAVRFLAGGALVVAVVAIADPRTLGLFTDFVAGDRLADAVEAFGEGASFNPDSAENAATANVLRRFGIWGEALRNISRSPIVGNGPFRLNDAQVANEEIAPLISLATKGDQRYVDFGAHNLPLQLLADGGLVLFGTFALAWASLWRRAPAGASPTAGPTTRALMMYAIGASLPSNAMASPALAFPMAAFLGPLLMSSRRAPAHVVEQSRLPSG